MYSFWTTVKIFLGKCQISCKKLRLGRKSRPHTRVIQPFIPISLFLSEPEQPATGAVVPRLGRATTRHNNQITKGGLNDE
jgi:hypothetical protein